ncbi:hypothetical protein EON73_05695 [bacterium]|nr:MAG: hypothetical protein EON73_05695 [bacterium]
MEDEEIAQRKPVWVALSEFYLDTELDESDILRIANILKLSGFTIEELKLINYEELAPIVSSNLLSVAGEWAGFDEVWLVSEIIKINSDFYKPHFCKYNLVRLVKEVKSQPCFC